MSGNPSAYTCRHYREEMILLQLQRRLEQGGLSPEERAAVEKALIEIKREMDMD